MRNPSTHSLDRPALTRRRGFRYSLRTFAIVCLVLGIVLGLLGMVLNQARQERQAVNAISRWGGQVYYADRYRFRGPDWIRRTSLGHDLLLTPFKVHIDGPRVTDREMPELSEHLASLSGLEVLNISNARISDAGLVALTKLPGRVCLGIENCPITDGALPHLAHFGTSQEQWLVGTKITPGGAAELADTIPGCAIMYDDDGQISAHQMAEHMQRRGAWNGR